MAELATVARISINLELGKKRIDGATIKPSTFATFADFIQVAQRMTQPAAFSARLLRVRMDEQASQLSHERRDGCAHARGSVAFDGAGFLRLSPSSIPKKAKC